jgi:RHS repeat-associated protein
LLISASPSFGRAAQLATITNTGPGNVAVGGYAYVRDANGNPLNVDVSGPTGIIVGESMRNTYDNGDRLTKTCFTTTTCVAANQSTWSYNAVGSRLTEKVGSAAVSTYTYDLADQLTAITGPGAATFTYNPNGDQLTAGADTFTYNTARQTTGVTVGGVATTYAYDGNGNRATVTTGGVVTGEVWDTMGGLPTLVAQRNTAGVVQRKYTYVGATPLRYEDTVAGTAGYYQTDEIGSVSNITTATGAIGATYRYNPYGTTRTATSVIPGYAANPMRYTGQQQDPTGNYNLRARQYNPGRGAFTQTDPMPMGAGSSFESSYVYSGARPTVMVDPSGMRFLGANQAGGSSANKRKRGLVSSADLDSLLPTRYAPFNGRGLAVDARSCGGQCSEAESKMSLDEIDIASSARAFGLHQPGISSGDDIGNARQHLFWSSAVMLYSRLDRSTAVRILDAHENIWGGKLYGKFGDDRKMDLINNEIGLSLAGEFWQQLPSLISVPAVFGDSFPHGAVLYPYVYTYLRPEVAKRLRDMSTSLLTSLVNREISVNGRAVWIDDVSKRGYYQK